MKAIIPNRPASNGKNLSPGKETIRVTHVLAAPKPGHGAAPVPIAEARFYMSRSNQANVVYCSVWLHAPGEPHGSGHGKASGYGYHKESAAFAEAIKSAGVTLSEDIAGCGSRAIEEALEAIAHAYGYAPETVTIVGSF